MRRDLPWPHRAVQGAHALASLIFHRRSWINEDWWSVHGPTFVFLGVDAEPELSSWLERLGDYAVGFWEPDLGNQLTAVAYLGPPLQDFSRLRLL